MARKNTIARCVVLAILSRNLHEDAASFFARLFARIVAFFSLYRLRYITFRDDLFRRLRNETWEIEEDEYAKSFQGPNNKEPLQAKGDMGYSGSVRIAQSTKSATSARDANTSGRRSTPHSMLSISSNPSRAGSSIPSFATTSSNPLQTTWHLTPPPSSYASPTSCPGATSVSVVR